MYPTAPFEQTVQLQLQSQYMSIAAPISQVIWIAFMPAIAVSKSAVDFTVAVGSIGIVELTVANSGNELLRINQVSLVTQPVKWLKMTELPEALEAQTNATLVVQCEPPTVGEYSNRITISSNAIADPELSIGITCTGTATCYDGYQNQDETSIDCGGAVCDPCETVIVVPPPPPATLPDGPLASPAMPANDAPASQMQNRPTVALPAPSSTVAPPDTESLPPLQSSVTNSPAQQLTSNTVQSNNQATVTVTDSSGRVVATVTVDGSGENLLVRPVDDATIARAVAASGGIKLGSQALEVSFANRKRHELTQVLSSPATLCFAYNERSNYDLACLGYINNEGKWQCEDTCLDKNSTSQLTCGRTGHFTSFAVLLSGGDDQCHRQYMTGSWKGDLAVAASVFGLVWGIALLCCVLYLFDTPLTKYLRNQHKPKKKRFSTQSSELDTSVNASDYYA
jgi:hypothetical protein